MSSFDQNKYKKIFEQRFGAGSFDSGLSEARKIGRLKTEASFAKKSYFEALREAERQRKKAEREAQKKTYNDALSYWNDPENKKKLKQEGADRWANEIRNNPLLQEEIKRNGFKITDYINALYAAASDGKFRSEREYKQFAKNLQKEANNRNKERNNDIYAKYGLDKPKTKKSATVSKKKEEKKDDKSVIDKIKSLLGGADDFYKRGLSKFANSAAFGVLDNIAEKLPKPLQKFKFRSPIAPTGISLEDIIKAEKEKPKNKVQKVTDTLYELAGYAVPGTGAVKAAKAVGLGAKITKDASKAKKALELGKEGAAAGAIFSAGEIAANEIFDPDKYSAKDHMKNLALNVGLGSVADPAIYGAGKGLQTLFSRLKNVKNEPINVLNDPKDYFDIPDYKYDGPIVRGTEKGQTIVEDPLKVLKLNAPEEPGYTNPFTGRKEPLQLNRRTERPLLEAKPLELPEPIYKFKEPINKEVKIEGTPMLEAPVGGGKPTEYWQQRLKELNDYVSNNEVLKEFKQAVEDQYQYLKQSLKNRKGVQKGVIKDREGYVQGAYGFSENPKWYQDFYRQFGRVPTNEDLRQLAREQVLNGFSDEVGELPAWRPSALENIENQINELNSYIQQIEEQNPLAKAQRLRQKADKLEQEAKQLEERNRSEFANVVAGQPIQKGKNYSETLRAREEKRHQLLKEAAKLREQADASEKFQIEKQKRAGMTETEKKIEKTQRDLKNKKAQLEAAESGKNPALEPFIPQLRKEVVTLERRLNKLLNEQKAAPKAEATPPKNPEIEAMQQLINALEQEKSVILRQLDNIRKAKNDDDVIRRIWEALKGDDNVTLEDLNKLANPPKDTNEPPLQFKHEKYFKKEPLRYVARLNPEDLKREQYQTAGFTTSPTNDGVRINPKKPIEEVLEELRFITQEEPLRFKKTVIRTNYDDGYTTFEEVKSQEKLKTEKEQIQERIDEIKQYMKSVKDNEQKEMYKKQIHALENDLKKIEEKELLEADVTFDELLRNADQWKDKTKFLLKRETMDRNFEDIMGKDAPIMKKIFLDPIKKSEAERIRFLNEERKKVKTYGIKPGSKDDELVQMYGEKKITLDELKQRTPNWKRVKEAAESYRKTYDRLLDTVNKVLTENGFDPIPKRKDYFPHFEEVDGILKQFGFDLENHTLPTDINGLTADFKPSKSFFRNALQRKGDQTDFGAAIGFDKYIEGISSVIFHTKNIKRLRALDKAIRNKYEGDTQLSNFAAELTEYTNLLAGKKSLWDRGFEDVFGRKIYNFFDTVRKRVSANMIGANVGSALTSYIPLTQALATTNKRAFVQGMFETILNTFKNDGFINESDFLTKRVGSDPLYRTWWDKTVEKSMWLMKTIDNFTAQTIVRGKYNELISKGVPHEQAIKQADEWASKIMADRSKGSMPTLFNTKTLGPLTQFQLEVNNQLSFLFKDMPRNMDKKGLASAMAQVLIYSYIFNNLYEKATGRRPAFDPIGVALQAYKDYNNGNITNLQATKKTTENVLNQLPFTSILNGGRYPMFAGLPDLNDILDGKSTLTKELTKPLTYLLPPAGGGQLRKTYEGLTIMNENPISPQPIPGVYRTNKDGENILRYPVEDNDPNFWRALLFGKYALPETKEFYDNNRRDLSPKQSKIVEEYPNPKAAYEAIMAERRENTILNKIKKIDKNEEMSNEEKTKKIQDLIEQLRRMREGR
jgi:hypothetical protein